MRWKGVLVGLLCFIHFSASQEISIEQIDEILNEVAKVEEEIANERAKLLSKPPKDLQERLKSITSQLEEIRRIKDTLKEYKKRLEEGMEVSTPPVIKDVGNVARAIGSLLGEEVDSDVAYAGKEGTVFSFIGEEGSVYVYGEVKEVYYYDDEGDRVKEDRFYPMWGVYMKKRTEVIVEEGDGKCVYTGGIVFHTPREVCPLTITIKGLGNIKTDGDALYGEVKVGVFDVSFQNRKINEISLFGKIVPEGQGVYVGSWDERFFLYTMPAISLDIGSVYMDRERVKFTNELIRLRKERIK
ncbi:hypothetical protein [Hydrogenivirga sp.]